MMRVLLSEALIDLEVREHFGERIIRPLNDGRKSDGVAYGALALVLGCVVLRLLGEADPRREKQAIAAFGEAGPASASDHEDRVLLQRYPRRYAALCGRL